MNEKKGTPKTQLGKEVSGVYGARIAPVRREKCFKHRNDFKHRGLKASYDFKQTASARHVHAHVHVHVHVLSTHMHTARHVHAE